MKKRGLLASVCLMGALLIAAGCEKHTLEDEISLEDASRLLVEQSREGIGIYGGNIVSASTNRGRFVEISSDSIDWSARWDFQPHSYGEATYDTATDRGVPGLRTATMPFTDNFEVTITLDLGGGNIFTKTNITAAQTHTFLVQLGKYGDIYHGWVMRKMAQRKFIGKVTGSPGIRQVVVSHAGNSTVLSTSMFSIDDVLYVSPGDSLAITVATNSPDDLLFLNVTDSGEIVRKPMPYDESNHHFVSGWRVSSAAKSRHYYQVFVEAYARGSFTSTDSGTVAVSGHSFAYRIN